MPERVQRKRVKGWLMPSGAVYVGRPSVWGNPFTVTDFGSRRAAVDRFVSHLRARRLAGPGWINLVAYPWETQIRRVLAGRDLVCWCPPDQPCHADVLLEIANGGES
jgi:hypothetical protein